jgi:galactokinase
MQYSEVRRLIDSSGFPNRLITTLGLNQSSMDEQDIKSLPERYRSLCTDAAELLALGEDEEVLVYSSPGRLMYAGNHAESWAGKSLGAAVNPDILALIRIREDSQVVLYSEGYEKPFHLSLDDLAPRREDRGEAHRADSRCRFGTQRSGGLRFGVSTHISIPGCCPEAA